MSKKEVILPAVSTYLSFLIISLLFIGSPFTGSYCNAGKGGSIVHYPAVYKTLAQRAMPLKGKDPNYVAPIYLGNNKEIKGLLYFIEKDTNVLRNDMPLVTWRTGKEVSRERFASLDYVNLPLKELDEWLAEAEGRIIRGNSGYTDAEIDVIKELGERYEDIRPTLLAWFNNFKEKQEALAHSGIEGSLLAANNMLNALVGTSLPQVDSGTINEVSRELNISPLVITGGTRLLTSFLPSPKSMESIKVLVNDIGHENTARRTIREVATLVQTVKNAKHNSVPIELIIRQRYHIIEAAEALSCELLDLVNYRLGLIDISGKQFTRRVKLLKQMDVLSELFKQLNKEAETLSRLLNETLKVTYRGTDVIGTKRLRNVTQYYSNFKSKVINLRNIAGRPAKITAKVAKISTKLRYGGWRLWLYKKTSNAKKLKGFLKLLFHFTK
jgi:hypothetical protein